MGDDATGYSLAQNRDIVVHVAHDDARLCETISVALRLEGYQARCFRDNSAFARAMDSAPPDVVILGEAMVELLTRIRNLNRGISVLVVQDEVNLDRALAAVGDGADDVVALPIDVERVLRGIRKTIAKRSPAVGATSPRGARFNALTEREREVLDLLLAGRSNKEVAELLNISHRTVEVHRSKIMRKTGARNGIDLVRRAVM